MMPLNFIDMIKGGQNPQQLMLAFLEQNATRNPMMANMLSLIKQDKADAIEGIARNYMQSQGRDFDTEFNSFKQKFGL